MAEILVVDDESGLRDSMRQLLEMDGHVVRTADDALVAIKLLETSSVDVVVADIVMPGMTGIELLEHIKRIDPNIKTIVITGEPTVETATEAVRKGAFDYISKPVSRPASGPPMVLCSMSFFTRSYSRIRARGRAEPWVRSST